MKLDADTGGRSGTVCCEEIRAIVVVELGLTRESMASEEMVAGKNMEVFCRPQGRRWCFIECDVQGYQRVIVHNLRNNSPVFAACTAR